MTERPILFSAPMVRALLDGTKTQTRRALKIQPVGIPHYGQASLTRSMTKPVFYAAWDERAADGSTMCACPYGVLGDRLWVRESYRLCADFDAQPPSAGSAANRIWYEADAPHQLGFGKGRPSIHMPRWASRILLEVTDVRVERLQEISGRDAIAEGIERVGARWRHYFFPTEDDASWEFPQNSFGSLWASINGEESWESNPWVWAITFQRIVA